MAPIIGRAACFTPFASNHAQLLTLHDAAFVRLAALAVLAARPPLLHSRLEFAARFVHSERCAALAFALHSPCVQHEKSTHVRKLRLSNRRLWDGALGGALSIVRAAVQWVAIQDPSTLQA